MWIKTSEKMPDVEKHPQNAYEKAQVIAASYDKRARFDPSRIQVLLYERATVNGKSVKRWKTTSGRIYKGAPVVLWTDIPAIEGK